MGTIIWLSLMWHHSRTPLMGVLWYFPPALVSASGNETLKCINKHVCRHESIWKHPLPCKLNHVPVAIHIKIQWLTDFCELISSYFPKPSVYCSHFYLNLNQCFFFINWQFSFVGLWKNWFVDSPCWDLTNQYDYFYSQCSCVCTTKTTICAWDIVREEGKKNKWMKGRSLIYGHALDLKCLVRNKMKQVRRAKWGFACARMWL